MDHDIVMNDALYEALYVSRAPFQWVHFTPHGIVRGQVSRWTVQLTEIFLKTLKAQEKALRSSSPSSASVS